MKEVISVLLLMCLFHVCASWPSKRSGCITSPDMVPCPLDPCYDERFRGCTGYQNASCVPNYCGGCIAEWYLNGQRVYCLHGDKTTPPSQ